MGRIWAIVVAGGSGTRFGRAQAVRLAGRAAGRSSASVAACRSVCDAVVLVVPAARPT